MDGLRLEEEWQQLRGLIKEKWDRLSEDDLTEINGRTERLKGRLRGLYGYTQEQAEDQVEEFLVSNPLDKELPRSPLRRPSSKNPV